MKHRTILFVCTGNTCRSPMAEAAMRAELKKKKVRWYRVQSAGLRAENGHTMSANSMQALSEAKIPFALDFCSKQLTQEMIEGAYMVVCMTEAQRAALKNYTNVTSLYALCGKEIPDPFGQGIDVYRVTLRIIRECLPRVIDVCCPPIEE